MSETSAPELEQLTPKQIVAELDRHIIGQDDAKRPWPLPYETAGGACNWRRNCAKRSALKIFYDRSHGGKTEIARRLAKLAKAPFIKIEATKFTEVGYVGRDVDSIIRDLVDVAINMLREEQIQRCSSKQRIGPRNAFLMPYCLHREMVTTTPKNPALDKCFARSYGKANWTKRKSKST